MSRQLQAAFAVFLANPVAFFLLWDYPGYAGFLACSVVLLAGTFLYMWSERPANSGSRPPACQLSDPSLMSRGDGISFLRRAKKIRAKKGFAVAAVTLSLPLFKMRKARPAAAARRPLDGEWSRGASGIARCEHSDNGQRGCGSVLMAILPTRRPSSSDISGPTRARAQQARK